jgi:hypothetical protein
MVRHRVQIPLILVVLYSIVIPLTCSPLYAEKRAWSLTNPRRCRIAEDEFNVELMKGEHKSPEFLAKQLFGQVPYIVRTPHQDH